MPLGLVTIGPAVGAEAQCFGTEKLDGDVHEASRAKGGGKRRYLALPRRVHLHEHLSPGLLRRADNARHGAAADWNKLPKKRMVWGDAEYNSDETVAHCNRKSVARGEECHVVEMHASILWLYRAWGLHIRNFCPGDEWFPEKRGNPGVADADRCGCLAM